jgi:uncharacterized membrane protein
MSLFIFFIEIMSIGFFMLILVRLIKLQHEYKNYNGLKYHRFAYMIIVIGIMISIIISVFFDYMSINIWLVLIYKASFLISSIFSYLFFTKTKFKFLKIFDKFIK